MDGTSDVIVTKMIIADEVIVRMIEEETVMIEGEITTAGETTLEDVPKMMTDIVDEKTMTKNVNVATEMRKMMKRLAKNANLTMNHPVSPVPAIVDLDPPPLPPLIHR